MKIDHEGIKENRARIDKCFPVADKEQKRKKNKGKEMKEKKGRYQERMENNGKE